VRQRSFAELDDDFVCRWQRLEESSVGENAFLSPHVVLPAVRHLTTVDTEPFLITVESRDESRLLSLGVFEDCCASSLMPCSHLRSWQCEYAFLDGMLIDRAAAAEAATYFFAWIADRAQHWNGVAFDKLPEDGAASGVLRQAADAAEATWFEDSSIERAAVMPSELPDDPLTLCSKKPRQNFRRNLRRLGDHGAVDVEFITDRDRIADCTQTFLELESAGWKGEAGSAMASQPDRAAFARELIARFADDQRAVFTMLKIDNRPIGVSLKLLAGTTLFAFKLGWAPEFAKHSPGAVTVGEVMRQVRDILPQVTELDSCSRPGSDIESLWPHRRRLVSGVFASTPTARLATGALTRIKRLKRQIQGL
jgi:CelD/BcsL family acetyltransferase involved in cellulose biosynthesis